MPLIKKKSGVLLLSDKPVLKYYSIHFFPLLFIYTKRILSGSTSFRKNKFNRISLCHRAKMADGFSTRLTLLYNGHSFFMVPASPVQLFKTQRHIESYRHYINRGVTMCQSFYVLNYMVHILLIFSMPFKSASGLKEILSIPCSIRKDANSRKSLGAWPHNPILVPVSFDFFITEAIISFTALFCSSKRLAIIAESRSMPNINCVKSFEPMENPSNLFANSSASNTLEGISTII